MSGLPREVLKWIQSLDLTWQVKTPKWDITNGYLTAEIFSWYFPQDIQMHSYNNGKSLDSKQKNWDLLKNFIKRHRLDIPSEVIDGTIHCKEGAAAMLLERMYELLTNRVIRKTPPEFETDFTDRGYQSKLPMHARSTASQSVKNNLRITEIQADSSLILNAQKSQKIINEHIDHRRMERQENPDRFNIRPSVGEASFRRPFPQQQEDGVTEERGESQDQQRSGSGISREPSVHFKEVQVRQLDKNALYNMPIQGY
ncbi:spermatogenesis-associated protein 4-like [Mya arenaria]|uniref:spermatogenesis-associated protein 4-like n=1 Tax=Mya arenaria TaxID=6604 RepID=UPI0022E2BDA9|nr:spermatogenesis-associated protein 4-like [Mya arenaria]